MGNLIDILTYVAPPVLLLLLGEGQGLGVVRGLVEDLFAVLVVVARVFRSVPIVIN